MDQTTLQAHRARNRRQSLLLAAAMAALLGSIGWLIGGIPVALGGLTAVVLGYHFSQSLSQQLLLRTHRAVPLTDLQAPQLYRAARTLARRAGLPAPTLYLFPHPSPNAFATGSVEQPVIALSQGLLNRLPWDAVVGVLGHELSHIRQGDLPLMGFADLASRITALFSGAGLLILLVSLPMILLTELDMPWLLVLLLLLAPQLSIVLQMALSRTREFEADRGSAELIGSPQPLIKALRQLDPPRLGLLSRLIFQRHLPAEPSQIRSHPPTEERIQRLQALAPQLRWSPLQVIGSLRYLPEMHPLQPIAHQRHWPWL